MDTQTIAKEIALTYIQNKDRKTPQQVFEAAVAGVQLTPDQARDIAALANNKIYKALLEQATDKRKVIFDPIKVIGPKTLVYKSAQVQGFDKYAQLNKFKLPDPKPAELLELEAFLEPTKQKEAEFMPSKNYEKIALEKTEAKLANDKIADARKKKIFTISKIAEQMVAANMNGVPVKE
ncbi:MAG: hypothetical protein ACP5JE_05035, partial [Thermoplasmata archaeon]